MAAKVVEAIKVVPAEITIRNLLPTNNWRQRLGTCSSTAASRNAAVDYRHVSTSFTERQNLTMRMSMRRFTRLTNAFSKKVENQSLRVTPAMEAGIADHVSSLEEIVGLLD
jgi:hypothetical protein